MSNLLTQTRAAAEEARALTRELSLEADTLRIRSEARGHGYNCPLFLEVRDRLLGMQTAFGELNHASNTLSLVLRRGDKSRWAERVHAWAQALVDAWLDEERW